MVPSAVLRSLAAVFVAVLLSAGALLAQEGDAIAAAERAVAEGRVEEAVTVYRALVAERPGDARLVANLGRVLALADRYGEAAEALERAVGLGADDVRTLLFWGSALWESGRPEEAEPVLTRAAAAARGTGAEFLAQHQLGRLRLWTGRPEEAVAPLERAATLRPGAADARLDLARALDGAGRTEEAIAAFREVAGLSPDSHHARWGLAQALVRAGRRQEAARELEAYRRLYEADQERTRRIRREEEALQRGWHLLETGRPAEAEEVFRGLGPVPDALVGLARAAAARGDAAGAVAALERAVELAPDRQDLRRMLGEARLAAEEREDG